MTLSVDPLNAASPDEFVSRLDGIYEHSPWIAERAAGKRPFASLAALKLALVAVVRDAGRDAHIAARLMREHLDHVEHNLALPADAACAGHEQRRRA